MHFYSPENDNFPTAIDVVDDSDNPNAANLMTPLEGVIDRTRYLYNRLSHQKFVAYALPGSFDDPSLNSVQATWANSAYQPDTDGLQILTFPTSEMAVGDEIYVSMTGSFKINQSSQGLAFASLFYKGLNGITTFVGGKLLGAQAVYSAGTSASYTPFAISGVINVSSVSGANLQVAIGGEVGFGITNLQLVGSNGSLLTGYRNV